MSGALSTVQQLAAYGDPTQAITYIAEVQVKAGNVSDALKTVQQIEAFHARALALASIAEAQVDVGDVSGSRETIELALQDTQRIEDAKDRVWTLIFLARVIGIEPD